MSETVDLPISRTDWASSSHAVLDERSRRFKAKKIELILGEATLRGCTRLLEVGTGSGVIASHFGQLVGPRGRVIGTDVSDRRTTDRHFEFRLVSGVDIPFEADSFDVVLTNHVIEHVRPPAAQLHHLREIHRVLRPGGVAYLAVPNRWRFYEAHFRLWFLSWLPSRLRDAYVRLAGRGSRYDCDPLSRPQLFSLVHRAGGFEVQDVTLCALGLTLAIERPGSLADRLVNRWRLQPWLGKLKPVLPTHVLLLRKREG
jgi:SAM-dependent methyltransferase